MTLTEEGKRLFRERVNSLVEDHTYKTNFLYLLNEIDKRDQTVESLLVLIKDLITFNKEVNKGTVDFEEKLEMIIHEG